ncbi:MAG: bile acid:sodium symporter [Saprospiraceae bacterium]|nr:bile acid:sodium symporter [Saprospiraceae bacterium]
MKSLIDPFVVLLLVTVVVAYFFPSWGKKDSDIPLDNISSAGIALIFFFYGLKLSPQKLRDGLKNIKLHVLVQTSTFVLFPLLVLPFYWTTTAEQNQMIWLAFFFLAALPSTVSSSVVMVSMAGGNVPAAIFNASISGLIGILVTPFLMSFFIVNTTGDFDLSVVYIKLLTEIILPVFAGLLLQPYLGQFTARYAKILTQFDRAVILLIIYKSFVRSFEENVFSTVATKDLGLIFLLTCGLFVLVYFLTGKMSRYQHFSREDRITAQYCGTKKSLVHGTVFSKILFPAAYPMGIILLPLMIYHALQILVISVLAGKEGKLTK